MIKVLHSMQIQSKMMSIEKDNSVHYAHKKILTFDNFHINTSAFKLVLAGLTRTDGMFKEEN